MSPSASTFKLTDIGLLLAVSLSFLLPVLLIGPPLGSADLLHHMTISNGWLESFEAGNLIPNWIDAENNGYGSVTVRLYPPLIHVTMAAFQMFLRNWGAAVFAAFLFWSVIGSLGVFLVTRDLSGSRNAALIAASIFVFMPYRTNQLCHAFMAGEFVSLSVLPFAVLFVRRLQAVPNLRDSLALAFALALLILSNIPQLIVAAVCLSVLAIVLTRRSTILSSAGYLILSGVVALLLTAFFWVRMIAEISWIKISGPTSDPLYLYSNNFLFDDVSFGGSTDSISLMFATNILLLTVSVAIISLIASNVIRKVRNDRSLLALGLALIVSVFLSTPLSAFVWDTVPLLQRIQFPWRFLSVVSLCSAVFIGLSFTFVDAELWSRHRKRVLISLGSVLILLTFTIRQDILTASYVEHGRFDAIVREAVPRPGLEDWQPTWTTSETFSAKAPSFPDGVSRSITDYATSPGVREFHINAGEPSVLRTGIMFYPHWRAAIDGKSAVAREVSGSLAVDVGAEASVVELQLVEPLYSIVSRVVSAFSLVILLVLAFLTKRPRSRPLEPERIWNT